MILSVSRRTDIPCYYSEWFFNRLREGFLYVRNPMNPHQVSKIVLSPEVVDCIVFWTKNPLPMLERLEELRDYHYYFQFTLTGYGKDVEANIPHKKDVMIPAFQRLSEQIGRERVIWRYDPIFFSETYTEEYHLKAFSQIAQALCGYTDTCVISFLDMYTKIEKSMKQLHIQERTEEELKAFAAKICEIARRNGMQMLSCAEKYDLSECGIAHGHCIDRALIEKLIGSSLQVGKDKNQRLECGCVESVEVGTYDTCLNGCKYCYANHGEEHVRKKCQAFDVNSPFLCSSLQENDKVSLRKVQSLKENG
ncbi:MAG: DUF1848 domain-containing protein [Lachnospiraceae bacterium]|nr:DUF1848 domain-containing protein [Lachnospiraceae bacterium]